MSHHGRNAKTALEKVVARWGPHIKIVNDNGSENMAKAGEYLRAVGAVQYWTRPYCPKEKPYIERLIGTLQKECLDYNYSPLNAAEPRGVVDAWLEKYHFYRPMNPWDS
jgi:transposase InsO family protein